MIGPTPMPEPDTEFRAGVWWVRCPPESPSEWRTALPHEAVEAERIAVLKFVGPLAKHWRKVMREIDFEKDPIQWHSACSLADAYQSVVETLEAREHRHG